MTADEKVGTCAACGQTYQRIQRKVLSVFCSLTCRRTYEREHGRVNPPTWPHAPHYSKSGYIYDYAPGHPSLANIKQRSRSDYMRVLAHRLVMERHLGRYLFPNESVHHKNGDKHDNRIDNLELWVGVQPGGQRVADLIDYVVRHHRDAVLARLEED